MNGRISTLVVVAFLSSSFLVQQLEALPYKRCTPPSRFPFYNRDPLLIIKGSSKGVCIGCDQLENCTTWDGSVHIRGYRVYNEEMRNKLYFPDLKEVTGHLLVSLLHDHRSLKDIFPNLAVIRGRTSLLFLDYALVVYQNNGLKEVNLPSLNVILGGGVRIEKNINLCYVNTVRWKSIMKTSTNDKYALVTSSNNNECYDMCFKDQCYPPAGHGVSGKQYCWSPGTSGSYSCQRLCNANCVGGCVDGSQAVCCHSDCLGGCSLANSAQHCHACRHVRLKDGTCAEKCPPGLFEYEEFYCAKSCETHLLEHDGKCVNRCPAGYKKERLSVGFLFQSKYMCKKCENEKCPRVCPVDKPLDSLSTLPKLKDCTIIDGNLVLRIKGGAGKITEILQENLGKIEEVRGYILVRESSALISLNFLKNLKLIQPKINPFKKEPILYNDKYALAILDNAKLENLWPFAISQLKISSGGIMVHLNPRLCPKDIYPLIDDVLKWNRTVSDSERPLAISKANGNQKACNIQKINVTVEVLPYNRACGFICLGVTWNEVTIKDDYRNVLFYTLSYRMAPNRNITEFDGVNSCESSDDRVWTRIDVPPKKPTLVNTSVINGRRATMLTKKIGKLKPFTLYAIFVEAYVLLDDGAKSDLIFFRTQEAIPSAPVGVEASFLSDTSLVVKWQPPLFPNGKITQYIIKYEKSKYSVWKQNFDWCNRQLTFSSQGSNSKDNGGDSGKDAGKDGNCFTNQTCDCDKEKKEVIKPEKQAALFAKEFQDKFFQTIFTKDNDDDDDPVNGTTTTGAPPTTVAQATTGNCSNSAQGCSPSSDTSTRSATTEPTSAPLTNYTRNSSLSTFPPTTPSPMIRIEVPSDQLQWTIDGLHHFADYTIIVCACTRVGCTHDTQCYRTKGRTGKKDSADDLPKPLKVVVDNDTKSFNLSWAAPPDPNVIVLKYEIKIIHVNEEKSRASLSAPLCVRGNMPTWYFRYDALTGNYSAQVRAITPAGNGSWSEAVTFVLAMKKPPPTQGNDDQSSVDVGAVAGVSVTACILFVVFGGLAVWYITRKRYSEKQIPGVLYASVNPEYMNSSDVYIADEWEVPRDKIKLLRELGNGSFGMVYEGEATDIVPGQARCRVAVKTVSENASIRDRVEFLHEASIMKAFNCNHVVRLLGVVSDGQPTLVIMELMEIGDLKNFLRSRRPEEGSLPPPTLRELLQMAAEIADGMAYLACRKFVHRDLAARNCMVTGDFVVKIGDFGMTRDIYETDYYRKGGKGLLPVRWMAPESLKDGVFTSATDVWSYAVVLWEMATLACQPYPGKSNEEVLKFVVEGGIIERPDDCPNRLFDLMTLCWQYNPKTRPTFLHIVELLENDINDAFTQRSYYHSLTPDQLNELKQAQAKGHHKSRQKAETVESHA